MAHYHFKNIIELIYVLLVVIDSPDLFYSRLKMKTT